MRALRLGGDAPRDADTLLDDLAIAELGEALGGAQHALDRSFGPRAEEGGEIRLARLRLGSLTKARARAEHAIGVADRHHALPMTALQGGRVRLAPDQLGVGEVALSQRVGDSEEVRPPGELRLGPERVIAEHVRDRRREERQPEHRGERGEPRARPAARSRFLHRCLHSVLDTAS